jgi:hypothetical protein
MTRVEIIDKIRKVQALYAGTDSAGEMKAAQAALERLKAQLDEIPASATAFQFSLPDPWKRQLFLALVRRHGLKPYRLPRQRRGTVMVRMPKPLLDRVLWPEFLELSQMLHAYLDEATRDIISRAVHGDLSEAPEQASLPDRNDSESDGVSRC